MADPGWLEVGQRNAENCASESVSARAVPRERARAGAASAGAVHAPAGGIKLFMVEIVEPWAAAQVVGDIIDRVIHVFAAAETLTSRKTAEQQWKCGVQQCSHEDPFPGSSQQNRGSGESLRGSGWDRIHAPSLSEAYRVPAATTGWSLSSRPTDSAKFLAWNRSAPCRGYRTSGSSSVASLNKTAGESNGG